MRITDLLDKRSISLNETPKTKSEALDRIIDLMVASGKINDREAYREQVILKSRKMERATKKDGTHLMVRTRPVGQLCWIS